MSHSTPVPSDVEPASLLDLVADCRAVAALLGGDVLLLDETPAESVAEVVVDLVVPAQRPRVLQVPVARRPLSYLPAGYGELPVEITDHLLVTTVGSWDGPLDL